VIDVGGGLGVPDRGGKPSIDLAQAGCSGWPRSAARARDVELWLEPGRFVVAEAGVLLARVTQTKRKGASATSASRPA
jgi:bifunctional diaminopimelate decarboxylase / aspartate kinase